MKKTSLLLIALVTLMIGTVKVDAASASINVTSNTKIVTIGNTVKVNVKVSSSDLGSWEYCISYDSKLLKLTSSTADAHSCVKAGVVSSTGQKSSTETFTFKALKSGNAKVTVKSYAVIGYKTESQMATTTNSVYIKTMTKSELEATYSTNAKLKSLQVGSYQLSPKFDPTKYDYQVEVENNVSSVNVSASKQDSKANLTGTGNINLTEGNNKVEIVVTAEKGNSLTYTINIYRKELDPIKVQIMGKNYTIIRKSDTLPTYDTFRETTVLYDGTQIPALYSEITEYTLIGLKDEEGNIYTYIYDGEINKLYKEVKSNSLIIYPLELPDNDNFKNYEKVEVDFNGNKVEAHKLTKDATKAIIYARNVETGDVLYYEYDLKGNTISRYSDEVEKYYEEKMEKYTYVLLGFAGLIIILFFLLIFKKPKTKYQPVDIKTEPQTMTKKELKKARKAEKKGKSIKEIDL